jgi:hypothetical protein
MNFKQFVCKNCANENEDSFLFLGEKDFKILSNNNNIDINMKSLLSSSDNNNSTTNNNLEIIEYPYNDNEDDIQDPNNSTTNIQKKLFTEDNDINEQQYKESQDIEPQYRMPNIYDKPKIYIETAENNNNDNIKENEINSNNNNNESSTLINNEDSLLQNKVLLSDYYSNMKNNLFNKKSKKKNSIINNVGGKKNISNNINNLLGVKVECPHPDKINFCAKSNDSFFSKKEKIIQKKERIESLNPIKVKKKSFNSKKSSKYIKIVKNKTENHNLKKSSNLPIMVNIHNNKYKYSNKSLNLKEKIKENILKVNPQKIKVRRKYTKRKESSKINELIFTYRNKENCSSLNKIYKKSQPTIINLSKNRIRYLSHTFFGELLLNNSAQRKTFTNINEKKKSFNLNTSEYLKSKIHNSLNASKIYVNPFAKVYDRKKNNLLD